MVLVNSTTSDGNPAVQHYWLKEFRLQSGTVIKNARLGYCVFGNPNGGKPILLHPALTGSPRAWVSGAKSQGDGWWSHCIGPDKLFDTNELTIICVDHLGGNGASSGADELGALADEISFVDGVEFCATVLRELGISELHAAVGGSIGGGQALAWLFQNQLKVERILDISGSVCFDDSEFFTLQADLLRGNASGAAEVVSKLPRHCHDLLQQTPAFDHVYEYVFSQIRELQRSYSPSEALRLARKVGFFRFVTPLFYQKRYEAYLKKMSEVEAKQRLESWIDHQGQTFVRRFSASALRQLCLMESRNQIPKILDVAGRLRKTGCKLFGFAVDGDVLFPASAHRNWYHEVREALGEDAHLVSTHVVRDDVNGHDHFLTEELLRSTAEIRQALASEFSTAERNCANV